MSSVSPEFTAQDEAYMRLALREAKRALQVGEVAVGCVLVLEDEEEGEDNIKMMTILATGSNQVNATRDATRHAEIVAMDRALTGGRSSDALQLPTSSRAVSEGMPSRDNAKELVDSNDSQDEELYGWKEGRLITEKDLSRCRLYVSNHEL